MSFAKLAARVREDARADGRRLLLMGGCARSGKTTIAHALQREIAASGGRCEVLGADCWIVDARARKPDSTVADRFDGLAFEQAVGAVLAGRPMRPPVYDVATRRRVADEGERVVRLEAGLLIAEGVIALFRERLRVIASLRVFVDVPDDLRRQRLETFYRTTKGFSADDAAALIDEREGEEVPTVRASARNADVIVRGDTLFS